MRKIIIIGCPGSGKTTFSVKLSALFGLPLIHLDESYHQSYWSPDPVTKKEQWCAYVASLLKGES